MVVPGRYTLLTADVVTNEGGVSKGAGEAAVAVNPLVSFPFENPFVVGCCCGCDDGCWDDGAVNPFDERGEGVGKNSGGRNGGSGGPPPAPGWEIDGSPPLDEDEDKVSEGVVAS